LYLLVRRGSRMTDALIVEREATRRVTALNRARREQEREDRAALHDTAAATLLMIGVGAVPGRRQWIADQARRDLDVLQGRTVVRAGSRVDLRAGLIALIGEQYISVRHESLPAVDVPARVAEAMLGGIREALSNVARHAPGHPASLSLTSGHPVVVEVRDDGPGFDPDQIPRHRHGIAQSIVARIGNVGGRAEVRSVPGAGTVVRVTWPDA